MTLRKGDTEQVGGNGIQHELMGDDPRKVNAVALLDAFMTENGKRALLATGDVVDLLIDVRTALVPETLLPTVVTV